MRWLGRSRCYSPLNRAHGLRRVPEEPFGLAFVASLILHAALVVSLVRLTDAPAERAGADVSAIFADLAAVAPASRPTSDPAPRPASSGDQPAAKRAAVASAKTTPKAAGPTRPTGDAGAPTVRRSRALAPASRTEPTGPAKDGPALMAAATTPLDTPVPVGLPPIAPVEPAASAKDEAALMAAGTTPLDIPEPAASTAFDIDTPLDAGWPSPPPLAFASPKPTRPTRGPAVASRIEPVTVPVGLPPIAPVEPAASAKDEPALMAAGTAPLETPKPAASTTFAIDTPLDAGRPEPPPLTLASLNATRSAKTLTPVPLLRETAEPAPHARLAGEPVWPTAELPETPPPPLPADEPPVETTRFVAPATVSATPSPIPGQAPVAPDHETPPVRPTIATREPQPSSLFGLNRDRALVRLDGPRTWVTDQPTRTISGTVLGGVPERLVVYVNGIPTDVNPAGRTFETAVLLRPGANELRAVMMDPAGLEAEDTITVQYVPRPPSKGITLSSPPDGLIIDPDDPPIVVVEGELDDRSPTTVWIAANDRRIPVTTSDGRFRHTLLLSDPLVHVRAETSGADAVHRSGTVTVRTAGARPRSGVLVMQWPAGTDGSAVEITATWRAHSDRLDTLVQTMRLPALGETAKGAPSDMFYLRGLKAGVYTLLVRYRGVPPLGDVRPTLYLPDKDHLAPRTLRAVSLKGGRRRVLAKVLMPQAILWSQEEWFSGTSESVDSMTKFRIPEGISWVERKADLP